MANDNRQSDRRYSGESYENLKRERERLRLRAIDLNRQKLVLENELASPGIADGQKNFLSQRLKSLSDDEDQISFQLSQKEQQLQEIKKQLKEATEVSGTTTISSITRANATVAAANSTHLANILRESLKNRAIQIQSEQRSDAPTLAQLQSVRAPSPIAFLALGMAALYIDALDIVLTIADVAGFIGTAISIVLNVWMFLAIRSVMNRGNTISLTIAGCIFIGLLASIVPLIGTILAAPLLILVAFMGIYNPKASAIKDAKNKIQEPMERMARSIAIARQRTAQTIQIARRIGKYSPRIAQLTRSLVRSKAFRSVSKGSRVMRRMLMGQAANSIPILRFLPFQLLTVWLTYRELQHNHREALALLAQYNETQAEEVEALATESITQAEVVSATITSPTTYPAPA